MNKYISASALIVSIGLVIPWTYASIPDANGVIHGCYNTKNGNERIIDTAVDSCGNSETAIQWNQTGPRGPQGPQGQQGPAGSGHVYTAFNTHEIEGAASLQPVVGLSSLPAGNYVFTMAVNSGVLNSGDQADLTCVASLSGTVVSTAAFTVPKFTNGTDIFVATVPNDSSFIVSCLADPGVITSTTKGLAIGRVTALQVGAIN